MLLYLAGPMTGVEDYNVPAFDQAHLALRNAGYAVHSPADMTRRYGTERPYGFYLKAGLYRLLECDGLALLDGWPRSNGARLEVTVAKAVGMPVRSVVEWL